MRTFWLGVGLTIALEIAVIAIIVMCGLVPVNADARPSGIEQLVAGAAFNASVGRHAQRDASSLRVTDQQLLAGVETYRNNCAGCHGGPSKRPAAFGESMFPPAPQFAIHAPTRPEWQLFWVLKHGARRTAMAAWGALLSDDEIRNTVAFLHRIDALPPAVRKEWMHTRE